MHSVWAPSVEVSGLEEQRNEKYAKELTVAPLASGRAVKGDRVYGVERCHRRDIKGIRNLQEGRHALAGAVFHGRKGELYQRYHKGMEDQLGALGLVLNCVVLWTTRYMNAAIEQLRAAGHPVLDDDIARLSRRSCLFRAPPPQRPRPLLLPAAPTGRRNARAPRPRPRRRRGGRVGRPVSADDHVGQRGHHRLARVDAGSAQDRHERRAEGLELCLRLPNVEGVRPIWGGSSDLRAGCSSTAEVARGSCVDDMSATA